MSVATIQQEVAGKTLVKDVVVDHLPRIGESVEVFWNESGEPAGDELIMSGIVKNVITTIRGFGHARAVVVLEDDDGK